MNDIQGKGTAYSIGVRSGQALAIGVLLLDLIDRLERENAPANVLDALHVASSSVTSAYTSLSYWAEISSGYRPAPESGQP